MGKSFEIKEGETKEEMEEGRKQIREQVGESCVIKEQGRNKGKGKITEAGHRACGKKL